MKGNLAWAIAIILGLFMWTSLSMFPNYYKNRKVSLSIRVTLIIFLIFCNIQRTIYLGPIHTDKMIESGFLPEGTLWYNFVPNYFLLYFCTLASYAAIIILIFPNLWVMETFFPFMIMGPIVTFILPSEKPYFWNSNAWEGINFFTFYFGHACTLFVALYWYLYGYTNYKFGKDAIIKSMVTGAIVVFGVEVWNQYFGTDFIIGEIQKGLELSWARPYTMLLILTVGPIYVMGGISFIYFFKPIFKGEQQEKLRDTWWEKFLIYVAKSQEERKKISEK